MRRVLFEQEDTMEMDLTTRGGVMKAMGAFNKLSAGKKPEEIRGLAGRIRGAAEALKVSMSGALKYYFEREERMKR